MAISSSPQTAASGPAARGMACRRCGRAIEEPGEVVSHHLTTDGVVLYTRCACGMLQVWLGPRLVGPAELVSRTCELSTPA